MRIWRSFANEHRVMTSLTNGHTTNFNWAGAAGTRSGLHRRGERIHVGSVRSPLGIRIELRRVVDLAWVRITSARITSACRRTIVPGSTSGDGGRMAGLILLFRHSRQMNRDPPGHAAILGGSQAISASITSGSFGSSGIGTTAGARGKESVPIEPSRCCLFGGGGPGVPGR